MSAGPLPRVGGLELRPLEGHHDEPLRARPHRLYVAVTTDCNRSCPWCSTASRPGKRTYLALDALARLLPERGPFELQLEGGEPTIHPRLEALVALARATGRCSLVVLATNAVLFATETEETERALARLGSPLLVKASVNHHLLERDRAHLERVRALATAARRLPGVRLVVNVRRRRDPAVGDDAWVVAAVEAAGLLPVANVFFLQRYGFARDDERLEVPHLVGADFTLANPDGRTFGQDLIARSDAMDALA